ncbi:MAG: ABC transporter ATP-binding protein [Pseudanabaena sp.]|jgi:energy-coupling factor transport system ATP-binding protein|uniref:ABC transporter ATP-binding protein n=1 Tax=Pseudanabaena mucicola TaxID=71190 RepID=UPI0025783B73|nr:ABC transporter ATP-binding protein [Pseudanabaena mucicola]MCA6571672.1 ABC transporter ATP-binding protein [Pseudanabaena sp. M53BS1SP1A06MG]MCA6582392.1 ABC transporter ATP-binding protein [Pseudanabaena sp. M34BS1SP1A06MG]MCA6586772.1 ABC transporter ATP-binding protein [Pseudanabaena sp. M051S1SP1A06QC]MCA6592920.1 ABC transporter ATP-binding protein [Pseudanabaena sp. M38BS1SP1A06MG]MCA6597249.1 ABC transporter ATP-binding protein [Pseudanabaena sp. M046S1SP1A06QC]MCA6602181.1 ABC tr
MLCIQNLYYHPPAAPEAILKNISFELQDRQLGVMVGPSGSGKSTLLEILAGFVEWTSGNIYWKSQELTPDHLQQICGLVFQFPERHFCGSTILEELRLGHIELDSDRIQSALNAVGLSHLNPSTSPQSLSGGQQRRLALAVQLIRQPSLLLLDEPTAGLDWSMRRQILGILEDLKKNWTILVVTHEPEELVSMADQTWVIAHGEIA